jgi:hypothetical protein
LNDPFGRCLADQKALGEIANLEQPPDFADYAAKRELGPFFSCNPIGDEEHAKPSAAYVGYVLQIHNDCALANLNQRDQSIAEFFCGVAVDPTMGFKHNDVIDYAFQQFHVWPPIFMAITSLPAYGDGVTIHHCRDDKTPASAEKTPFRVTSIYLTCV